MKWATSNPPHPVTALITKMGELSDTGSDDTAITIGDVDFSELTVKDEYYVLET